MIANYNTTACSRSEACSERDLAKLLTGKLPTLLVVIPYVTFNHNLSLTYLPCFKYFVSQNVIFDLTEAENWCICLFCFKERPTPPLRPRCFVDIPLGISYYVTTINFQPISQGIVECCYFNVINVAGLYSRHQISHGKRLCKY